MLKNNIESRNKKEEINQKRIKRRTHRIANKEGTKPEISKKGSKS